MRLPFAPLALILCASACSSSLPVPFLVVTAPLNATVRDSETGEPIEGARACAKIVIEETALLTWPVPHQSRSPTLRRYSFHLTTSEDSGRIHIRGVVPHWSPIGWYVDWRTLFVEADGYRALVIDREDDDPEVGPLPEGMGRIGAGRADERGTIVKLEDLVLESTAAWTPARRRAARIGALVGQVRDACKVAGRPDGAWEP